MKRVWPVLLVVLVIGVGLLVWQSVTLKDDTSLAGRNRVVFQLQWTPQAQFVGFFVAKAKNYYAQEGLDVEFRSGGPEVNPLRNVATGEAQIGLATGDQVLVFEDQNTDPAKELRVVGTVFKDSLACFMSHAKLNVRTPADFVGKRVGVFPSYDTEHVLLALLQSNKPPIDVKSVQVVTFPSLAAFKDGSVDVFGAYAINEPIWASSPLKKSLFYS